MHATEAKHGFTLGAFSAESNGTSTAAQKWKMGVGKVRLMNRMSSGSSDVLDKVDEESNENAGESVGDVDVSAPKQEKRWGAKQKELWESVKHANQHHVHKEANWGKQLEAEEKMKAEGMRGVNYEASDILRSIHEFEMKKANEQKEQMQLMQSQKIERHDQFVHDMDALFARKSDKEIAAEKAQAEADKKDVHKMTSEQRQKYLLKNTLNKKDLKNAHKEALNMSTHERVSAMKTANDEFERKHAEKLAKQAEEEEKRKNKSQRAAASLKELQEYEQNRDSKKSAEILQDSVKKEKYKKPKLKKLPADVTKMYAGLKMSGQVKNIKNDMKDKDFSTVKQIRDSYKHADKLDIVAKNSIDMPDYMQKNNVMEDIEKLWALKEEQATQKKVESENAQFKDAKEDVCIIEQASPSLGRNESAKKLKASSQSSDKAAAPQFGYSPPKRDQNKGSTNTLSSTTASSTEEPMQQKRAAANRPSQEKAQPAPKKEINLWAAKPGMEKHIHTDHASKMSAIEKAWNAHGNHDQEQLRNSANAVADKEVAREERMEQCDK